MANLISQGNDSKDSNDRYIIRRRVLYNNSILFYTLYYFFSYRPGLSKVLAELLFRAVRSYTLRECF
jgi:hypothetical protein